MRIRISQPSLPDGHTRPRPAWSKSVAGLLLALCSGACFGGAATDSREYQIKAAFLYNFTRFTDWPAQSFSDAGSPIRVGTYCGGAFSAMLERLVAGRTVNGRSIVVTELADAAGARVMHAVFVCSGSDIPLPDIADAVKASPVLTVSETPRAAAGNACIEFSVDGGKVRFEVDMAASERAGLKISAQLQKLAKNVRRSS
jgi:hypothetical protein